MKSRKIISLLSAAAMSASVFSGLALTAHAEDTVLWSDTFDLQSTKEKFVYREGSGPTTDAETIPGIMMSTTNRSGGDEGSYYSIAEKSTDDKYLNVGQTFFGDYLKNERWAHIDFINDQSEVTSFTATADTDIVIDFDMLMKDGVDAANSNETIDPVLRIGGFAGEKSLNDVIEISRDEEKIAENTWVDVRIIVTYEGATAYVNGTEATTNAAMTSIASIGFIVPDGTTTYNPTVEGAAPAEIGFDNVVVYSSDAGVTTATSAAPAATAQDPGTVTYETVPEPAAPEDLYLVASENFDSSTAGRVAHYSVSDYVYENVVATFMVGQTEVENDAAGENNWTITTNTATDPDEGTNNYIAANNGRRSSGGRGPKMEFNYGEIAERETVVAQFATRLHSSDGQPAEMIFLGSDVVSSTTNNVAAPVAMITTDANADSEVYVCANPLTKGGANVIQVPDGQWITVKIEAYRSEGKTAGAKISVDVDGELKYIFGSEEEYANLQDDNRSGINTLPLISFRSGNASFYGNGNASNTSNDIDNISIYSSNEPEASAADGVTMTVNEDDQTVSLTATTAGSAVLVQASYNTAKVLSDINVVPVSITVDGIALSASGEGAQLNAFTRGDKFMVFDSLADLTPLCDAHTVVNGAEPVEPETYGITVTAPVNGTVTTDPSGSAEAGDTVTIMASPAEGYEVDAITVTAEDQSTVTVTDNEFTMPAQAVTVTVTFKEASTQPEDPIPYADGTVTFDEENAESAFVDYSRTEITIEDMSGVETSANKTKVQSIKKSDDNGQAGAGYTIFSDGTPATGDEVAVSFDVNLPVRNAFLSVRDSVPGTDHRNQDATDRIFTIGAEGSYELKIYNGGETVSVADTNLQTGWYHVDAVINNTAKTFDIKIYDYLANNNYASATPLYSETGLPFRDNTASGVLAMDFFSSTSGAIMNIDNVYVIDPAAE